MSATRKATRDPRAIRCRGDPGHCGDRARARLCRGCGADRVRRRARSRPRLRPLARSRRGAPTRCFTSGSPAHVASPRVEAVIGDEAIYSDAASSDLVPSACATGRQVPRGSTKGPPFGPRVPDRDDAPCRRLDRVRGRGDGRLRRAARLRARGVPAVEVRVIVERDRRARPRALALRGRLRAARARSCPACSRFFVPELPPALPPAERTVGQLIAETIRAYGQQLLARAAARDPARGRRLRSQLGHSAKCRRSSCSHSRR